MNDELRRLYEELETVSRHKSEFLANMSHELRTPLNAIIGFSELLQQQSFGELNERQLGYVDDVLGAGPHLLSLINDILDLSKVEAGRMELELVRLLAAPRRSRAALTMHAERASQRWGRARARRLDAAMRSACAPTSGSSGRSSSTCCPTPSSSRRRAAASTCERSGRDGVVEVAVHRHRARASPPEDQELIFEEFRQARGRVRRANEGTGLGLPLARRFIELHGGRLWVESELGAGQHLPIHAARRSGRMSRRWRTSSS